MVRQHRLRIGLLYLNILNNNNYRTHVLLCQVLLWNIRLYFVLHFIHITHNISIAYMFFTVNSSVLILSYHIPIASSTAAFNSFHVHYYQANAEVYYISILSPKGEIVIMAIKRIAKPSNRKGGYHAANDRNN